MSPVDTQKGAERAAPADRKAEGGRRQAAKAGRPAAKATHPKRRWARAAVAVGLIAVVTAVGAFTRGWWLPYVWTAVGSWQSSGEHAAGHAHEEHLDDESSHAPETAHSHPGHDAATSLKLSEQGRKNIGLNLVTIEPRSFERTVNIPGMVVDRAGRTEINVSAPMTGIVTRIYPIRGEAVSPGAPLFDVRLTHEDLVDTQSDFLETLEQLDVIRKEVARLEDVTSSGAVAAKRLLERQYDQQITEGLLRAKRQALLLHGLTEEQVRTIESTRELFQEVTIAAPRPPDCNSCRGHEEYLQVRDLAVTAGEHITAGAALCTLTDHCELYIEGKAFEEDARDLTEAANLGTPITAVVEANGHGTHTVANLKILYVENAVELESRALLFYVRLPNELVRNAKTEDGHRFIGWRYKPGQRVQIHVPVERWENRIVLPVDAVVQEGPEWFVFQQNGDHFDRKAVHVEYRDRRWAVIDNDGTLFPGDVVAASGAYQLHLALKNKAGGGVDPHAGHHH